MKALSVKQPWASLIIMWLKTIEVRTWVTKYRGPVLICSSQKPDADAMDLDRVNDLMDVETMTPLGQALGVVDLVDCRELGKRDIGTPGTVILPELTEKSLAWVLDNPRRIQPFTVKGRLGLWTPGAWCDRCRHIRLDGACFGMHSSHTETCVNWLPADSLFGVKPDA